MSSSRAKPYYKCSMLVPFMMQDSSGIWQALPFEVAHGIVRTATLHCHDYANAKETLGELQEKDPTFSKSKTVKARELVSGLESSTRFIVFNKRTGSVATPEWLARNITTSPTGEPEVKSQKSAWVMTLQIVLVGSDFNLALKTSSDSEFRPVRCFSLKDGMEKHRIISLCDGYQHLLDNGQDDEEGLT